MQEFLAKTTEDFSDRNVLNLDEDTTNNFAVYNENVIIIKEIQGGNEVVSADNDSEQYIFANADETILSLQPGDIFSYEYADGTVLIVKVDSIAVDGDNVTITGADTSMEDVFDYVKIDTVFHYRRGRN